MGLEGPWGPFLRSASRREGQIRAEAPACHARLAPLRTALLTAFTLLAFAANSLLCRAALGEQRIDPTSFTTVRLVSGALALVLLARVFGEAREPGEARSSATSWASGVVLFVYAIAFSLAYVSLNTGTGALILFGTVQVTMIGAALRGGERLGAGQWLGLLAAVAGLVYLVSPGLEAPDPVGALLMTASGVAWGLYSLRGRGAKAPVRGTASNFVHSVPLTLVASGAGLSFAHLEPVGVALAATSGVVTSGLGYALWYRALRGLSTTQASVVQLLVPVLAAGAGVAFLAEPLSTRLVTASGAILGGVAVVVVARGRQGI